MKKFYLIHGFESMPNRGFLPWLMLELYKKSESFAASLEMPNSELPLTSEWVKKIQDEVGEPNLEKYLIGHSLGVPAILRYLEALPEGGNIGAVFLISGFTTKLDELNPNSILRKIDNFLEEPFNFEHIKKVCRKFYIVHGEKDTTVPVSLAQNLGRELSSIPIIVKNAGHFPSSQVFELPELLEIILKEIK